MWYSLLLLGYKPVQHVTVLNTVGNCNTVVIFYYIMLCCVVLCCVMLYYVVLCCVMLCYVILYYIILYYIILYYIILLYYYNLKGPPSYLRSVVDRNVVMRRVTVLTISNFLCVEQFSIYFQMKNRIHNIPYLQDGPLVQSFRSMDNAV